MGAKVAGEPEDGYEVTQIHISQGTTPESMTISWVTPSASNSQVRFGLTPNRLDQTAEGDSTTYEYSYYEYSDYRSGVIHHVTLEGLRPNTNYFYQCGDIDSDVMSGVLAFKTTPAVGDTDPFTFAVVGDLGQTTDAESTVCNLFRTTTSFECFVLCCVMIAHILLNNG